jgi:hypothetical protein
MLDLQALQAGVDGRAQIGGVEVARAPAAYPADVGVGAGRLGGNHDAVAPPGLLEPVPM